jgi:hypothetical protein
MTKATWRDLRVHYFQLIDLVYFIDHHVSLLILFSLGHNFSQTQPHNGVEPRIFLVLHCVPDLPNNGSFVCCCGIE